MIASYTLSGLLNHGGNERTEAGPLSSSDARPTVAVVRHDATLLCNGWWDDWSRKQPTSLRGPRLQKIEALVEELRFALPDALNLFLERVNPLRGLCFRK